MRFLCLYGPGTAESHAPPTPQEQETMGNLIGDMAKAGVLLAVEGCLPSSYCVRVDIDSGKFTVTDGPFPETKELIAGFCLMQVKSKEEAVEWGKRFLRVVGEGQSEIRQLHEMPAG
ncbi:MAG: YciI family protein [Pseudomonadota bacterium]